MARARASQKIYSRRLQRKDKTTNKSNYPTVRSVKIKQTNYSQGKKTIYNRNYRKID